LVQYSPMFVSSPHITYCYDPLASNHKTNLGSRRDEERLENEERFGLSNCI